MPTSFASISSITTARPPRPYPGLRPFEPEEWSIFFGRERIIDDVIGRMASQNLVFIHGASGSGKSSLVRSGILPKLARQHLRRGSPWLTCAMRPSGGPLWNLAREFARFEQRDTDIARISEITRLFNQRGATLASVRSALDIPPGTRLCILIDQFEELFRFERESSREEAELFIELICAATRQDAETEQAGDSTQSESAVVPAPAKENVAAADIYLLITMRSEFLGECARFDGFAEAINQTQYLVPRMSGDEILRAIRRPAELYNSEITLDLADSLVADARGREDELPLIQHGLMLIWSGEKVKENGKASVDFDLLNRIGGLSLLLSDHADKIMSAVAPDAQRAEAVEKLFRALIDINAEGYAIRRPQKFRSLVALVGIPAPDLRDIIDGFRADGVSFLTPYPPTPLSEDTIIDISHEALIRCWNKIADPQTGWLKREFDDGLIWRSLRVEAKEYELDETRILSRATTNERESWLSTRTAAWSLRYGGDYPLVSRLISASRKAAEIVSAQQRRTRLFLYCLTGCAVIMAAVTLYFERTATQSRDSSAQALSFAQTRESLFLADGARQQAKAEHPVTAALLALRGLPPNGNRPWVGETGGALVEAINLPREVKTLSGHDDAVVVAAFSPDGARVLTASEDKTARLWSVSTGKQIAILQGHDDGLTSATFSSDGARVVTASRDKTVRVWDTATGQEIKALRGHTDVVNSAVFSQNGKLVLSASKDKTARIWNVETGETVNVLTGHGEIVNSAVFSPNEKQVVTASEDNTARLWDVATGHELKAFRGHQNAVNSAIFSSDGMRVLTASDDKTAGIWDATTGEEKIVLRGHSDLINSAVFSPDGSRVLTASNDKTARLWDSTTGKEAVALVGHTYFVKSAVFSPDGAFVVTASADQTAELWDARTGRKIEALLGHDHEVNSAVFSRDGAQVVTASNDRTARLWNAGTGRELPTLIGHRNAVISGNFSPDGSRVITASADQTARIWNAAAGQLVAVLEGHTNALTSAVFSPDGSRAATSSRDNTARVWDTATGQTTAVLKGHGGTVFSVVFSPDGSRLLTASQDATSRLWDTQTGQEILVLRGHSDAVNSAVFSQDGKRVVTASNDQTVRIWDVATGAVLQIFLGHQLSVRSAVFDGEGARVLSASWDKTARIWDATTGKAILVLQGHDDVLSAAVFSPDGSRVLTSSGDNTSRLWDSRTGRMIFSMRHEKPVYSGVFDTSGSRVLTASVDSTARVWDATTGQPIEVLRVHQAALETAAFSPDSTRVITTSDDNTARVLWIGLSKADLLKYANETMPRNLTPDEERKYLFSIDAQ
jgi:WD40 repeat protein